MVPRASGESGAGCKSLPKCSCVGQSSGVAKGKIRRRRPEN
jgi:hypothetical protein